jgi:hypothetical protein
VRRAGSLAIAVLLLGTATGVAAQQASVRVERGPHYVGEAVSIRISADGFEEEPAPEIEVEPPERGSLVFVGVSPSVSESITIVNGQMRRTRQVSHVFEYRFVANEAGEVAIGPFRVSQGAIERSVPAVRIKLRAVPTSDAVRVALELPDGPVYVGERVPVALEFLIERELQRNMQGYTLRAPLFDLGDDVQLLEPQDDVEGGTDLVVQTAKGGLELRGSASEVTLDGQRFLRVRVERTLVPLRAGLLEIPQASAVVNEGTRFRRDLFGQRTATQVRKWRATDEPRRIEVRNIPAEGRPASFAGAVGTGFSFDVAADRTVVRVGDPITLTLTLRGEGLETASLPPLDADGLLPAQSFRVPDANLPGELGEGTKRFSAVVRVRDDRIQEIPALAYSWFDPGTGRYETTQSRPVALSVRPAEVIGAADVESRQPPEETAEDVAEPRAQRPAARHAALTGADLAIERDPAVLLRDARAGPGGVWLTGGLYAGSVLLVALACVDRRRRDVDPALARRRGVLAEQQRVVQGARDLPPAEAAERIAGALRRMLAELPDYRDPELDALIGECDARRYAPPGRGGEGAADLAQRAVLAAQRIAEAA